MSMNIKEIAKNYKPDQSCIDIVRQSQTAFCVGITSAGKDTIVNRLLESPDYYRLISHTTRQPRVNNGILEKNGIDYYFVSVDQMAELLNNHKMVEINCFGGNYYGVSVDELTKANANQQIATSDIDIHGIASFRNIAPDTLAIFVVPPDYETWVARNKNRYESIELFNQDWKIRRDHAIDELQHALVEPNYFFIVNDRLEDAVKMADKIAHRDSETINQGDSLARSKAQHILDAIKRTK